MNCHENVLDDHRFLLSATIYQPIKNVDLFSLKHKNKVIVKPLQW